MAVATPKEEPGTYRLPNDAWLPCVKSTHSATQIIAEMLTYKRRTTTGWLFYNQCKNKIKGLGWMPKCSLYGARSRIGGD